MKKITADEILNLIKKLPDSEYHIFKDEKNDMYNVTTEWLVGSFAGAAFESTSYKKAAEKMIDYLYENFKYDSIVGDILNKSGFPNLEKMYEYCINIENS